MVLKIYVYLTVPTNDVWRHIPGDIQKYLEMK